MKLAAVITLVGVFMVAVGVGLYDYRAGLIIFGAAAVYVGASNLTQEP